MWTRERLKTEAKRVLKAGYALPLLVSFVATLLGANGGGGGGGSVAGSTVGSASSTVSNDYNAIFASRDFTEVLNYIGDKIMSNLGIITLTTAMIILFVLIGLIVGFAFSSFVSGPVGVGQCRFYMENRAFGTTFGKIFYAFTSGNYLNIVKTVFLKDIKIALWSLLFVIPGIIKSYEYSMIPYILSENPGMTDERAFELSKKMTDGEKWKMFVLDLSFIGWFLLGTLACCIGTHFVVPYEQATKAELYQVMREKAFGMGFADQVDLPGYPAPGVVING